MDRFNDIVKLTINSIKIVLCQLTELTGTIMEKVTHNI